MVSPTDRAPYQDVKVDTKVVLAGLWTATLLLFAYVDIFAFWRADVINGALEGEVPGQGITIGQGFLAASTAFIIIPTLMIPLSLLAKASVNRLVNLMTSAVFALVIAGLCIGEEWYYYLLGSFFEVVLLITAFMTAWRWPTAAPAMSTTTAARFAGS